MIMYMSKRYYEFRSYDKKSFKLEMKHEKYFKERVNKAMSMYIIDNEDPNNISEKTQLIIDYLLNTKDQEIQKYINEEINNDEVNNENNQKSEP